MKVEYSHNKTVEQVMNILKDYVQRLKQEHGDKVSNLQEKWTNNGAEFSGKVMGFTINGILKVLDNKIEIESKLPLMLKGFESTIKQTIEKELAKLLK